MTALKFDPYRAEDPAEIIIKSQSLKRVICQVTFPKIMKISDPSYMTEFQERIRHEYPHVERENRIILKIGDTEQPVTQTAVLWRFLDISTRWRFTISDDSFSLESQAYVTRNDFLERLSILLEHIEAVIKPSHMSRIGVRFINQFLPLSEVVEDEFFNPGYIKVYSSIREEPQNYVITELLCASEEGMLRAKWGVLPPNGTHDGESLKPIELKSLFLDIDAYMENVNEPFRVARVLEKVEVASKACYRFFRWMIRDEYINKNRGEA